MQAHRLQQRLLRVAQFGQMRFAPDQQARVQLVRWPAGRRGSSGCWPEPDAAGRCQSAGWRRPQACTPITRPKTGALASTEKRMSFMAECFLIFWDGHVGWAPHPTQWLMRLISRRRRLRAPERRCNCASLIGKKPTMKPLSGKCAKVGHLLHDKGFALDDGLVSVPQHLPGRLLCWNFVRHHAKRQVPAGTASVPRIVAP